MKRRGENLLVMLALAALGSAIGGTVRWQLSLTALYSAGLPAAWSLLMVNTSGSILIGLYAAWTAPGGRALAGPRQRVFVVAGLCGGFTSFSLFSLETLLLVEAGNPVLATTYIVLSLVGWLAGAWIGYAYGMRLNRLRTSVS